MLQEICKPQTETGWTLSSEQDDCTKQLGNGTAALQSPAGSLRKQLLHTAGDSSSQEPMPCLSVMAYFKNVTLHQRKKFHYEDPPQEVWCAMKLTLLIMADLALKAEHIHPQHAQTLLLSVLKMAQVACHQLPSQSLLKCFLLSQGYNVMRSYGKIK